MSKTFYSAPIIAILYFSNNLANSGIQILKIIINGDNTEDGLIESSHEPLACTQGGCKPSIPQRA